MSGEQRKSIEVSHGRGGAGNIGADDTPYVDGEIVRVGTPGPHGDGAFSSGRGGVGNIGSPRQAPGKRADAEVVPPLALRAEEDGDHHVGRGGKGNVVKKEDFTGGKKLADAHRASGSGGFAGKLKEKLFGRKSKSPEVAEAKVNGETNAATTTTATYATPKA